MKKFLIISSLVFFTSIIHSQNEQKLPKKPKDISQRQEMEMRENYQKVINNFRKYLATVPKEVRDEIREYRMKIVELNKQKKILYGRLSQQAQNYLKNEHEAKKKLPLEYRKFMKANNNSQKSQQKTTSEED